MADRESRRVNYDCNLKNKTILYIKIQNLTMLATSPAIMIVRQMNICVALVNLLIIICFFTEGIGLNLFMDGLEAF